MAERDSKGRFVKGHKQINSGRTRFKKGVSPWNKGKKTGIKTSGRFRKNDKRLKGNVFAGKYVKVKYRKHPMKGKHHSEETKKKISKSRTGKCKGVEHYKWKGGITSHEYKERRKFQMTVQKKVFERDNYTCQICGEYGGQLQVDHIQSWAEYVELRFCMDNCRTVCMGCHYKITFNKPMPKAIKTWGHNLVKGGEYHS